MDRLKQYDLVYLGTPYSKFPTGTEAAFQAAASLAGRMLVAGVNVYSPIAHTHPIAIHSGLNPLDHSIWIPFDAAMMDKADALVVAMMDSWEASYGLQIETDEFTQAGKPVYWLDPVTMALTDVPQ